MDELLPTLECDLADTELCQTARAALTEETIALSLKAAPSGPSWHVLGLTSTSHSTVVLAMPEGTREGERFVLRVKPIDPIQLPELEALASLVAAPRRSGRPAQGRNSEAPPSAEGLVGRVLAGGKFQVERLIGEGGVGGVYEASHRDLKKRVAIKFPHRVFHEDPKFAARFQAEALAASHFDHPNAVRVLDFGREPDGLLYIVMEFLEGRSLDDLVQKEGKQPLARVLPLLLQTCSALAAAHDRGIIHRDIKPANIVIVTGHDDEGRAMEIVKVCDFGIATMKEDGPREEGAVVGSPAYMSPEQGQSLPTDARSDIYSLGVTFYELVVGKGPFDAIDGTRLILKHIMDAPPVPSSVEPSLSEEIDRIILKCLEKDPAARYGSMRELRTDLRALEGTKEPEAATEEQAPIEDTSQFMAVHAWLVAEEQTSMLSSDPENVLSRLEALDDEKLLAELVWVRHAFGLLAKEKKVTTAAFVAARLAALAAASKSQKRVRGIQHCLGALDEEPTFSIFADAALRDTAEGREAARRLLGRRPQEAAFSLVRARIAAPDLPQLSFIESVRVFADSIVTPLFAEILQLTGEASLDLFGNLLGALAAVPGVSSADGARRVANHLASLLPHPDPRAEIAVLSALVNLSGAECRTALIPLLDRRDENVRVAAVSALRRIGAIDAEVVAKIDRMLSETVSTTHPTKLMLAAALGEVAPTARSAAMVALAKVVRPRRGSIVGAFRDVMTSDSSADLVFLASQILVQKGGSQGRTVVEERVKSSKEPLKSRLAALLLAPPPPPPPK